MVAGSDFTSGYAILATFQFLPLNFFNKKQEVGSDTSIYKHRMQARCSKAKLSECLEQSCEDKDLVQQLLQGLQTTASEKT